MKHLKRLLPVMAALLVSLQTAGIPVFAYHQQQNSAASTIITAGAIGAGAGAVTSIITGHGSPLKGAAVGAVIGAGSGAVYQAVRYNGNNDGYYRQTNHYNRGYGSYNQGNNWHGRHGYNRGHDAYYNNYPHHQTQSYYDNNGYRGRGNGYAYNQPYSRGCPNGGGQTFRRVRTNW
jgi:hypothetical protein